MPEGRMLKKVISTSKKLADLETNEARLLYTWLIPHLDIKGRFSADSFIVKGAIVPRLNSFTPENIKLYLQDMVKQDLILVYEINGDKFLQLKKFAEFQILNKSKEAGSHIPDPSGITIPPDSVLDNSGSSPALSKVKQSKVNKLNVT